MSFSDGQLRQWGNALEAADWTAEDMTLMGQAGHDRLIGIRDSLRRGGEIVAAIEGGKTELWLAPGQDTGWVQGRKILAHLTNTGLLAGCADLAELEAIRAKGLEFFRRYFAGKALFGWRGVQDGLMPYLVEYDDKVILFWLHLDNDWYAFYPALRRK
jgi:hypothetical protein